MQQEVLQDTEKVTSPTGLKIKVGEIDLKNTFGYTKSCTVSHDSTRVLSHLCKIAAAILPHTCFKFFRPEASLCRVNFESKLSRWVYSSQQACLRNGTREHRLCFRNAIQWSLIYIRYCLLFQRISFATALAFLMTVKLLWNSLWRTIFSL